MAASILNYLIVTLVAVALCIWAAGSAVPRVQEHEPRHRLWTLIGAALLLPTFAAAVLSVPLGQPMLAYGAILLPAVVVCGTWSNIMTLRDQHLALKILHLPIFLFNAALVGLYAVRVTQDFLAEDLGTWGSALTLAHVEVQTRVGCDAAASNPIWLHLPFLLPLYLRFRWYHVAALTTAGVLSTAMLVMLFAAMPMAYNRASSYRNPPPQDSWPIPSTQASPTSRPSPRVRPVGVKAPWGLQVLSTTTLRQVRDALLDLGTPTVAVDVSADTFADERLNGQLARELAWARKHNMPVVAICRPSRSLHVLPSASLEDLRRELAQTQWLAAENLKPALLVLFAGPFGRLAATTQESPTIDAWLQAIARSAREARQANPDVKVAVAIESLAPHAAELFRRLRADDSPADLDVVGLSVFPRQRLMPDLDKHLSRLCGLVTGSAGSRRVEILEAGCSPHETGGELGQWHFLMRVLALANRVDAIQAVCIDALSDPGSTRGLLTWTGRRRLAFRLLDATTTAAARPGK